MMAWIGSIALNEGSVLHDIRITGAEDGHPLAIPDKATLRLLSIVETGRIPLHLSVGRARKVTSSNDDTISWFGQIFASPGDDDEPAWWETARPDSPLGVLVGVESGESIKGNSKGPRVTELLLYASSSETSNGRLPTPPASSPDFDNERQRSTQTLTVHALPLSSDLVHAAEPTPPSSPAEADEDVEAVFLPQAFVAGEEVINEPPVRKRKSAADAFDEASERRQKARRRGGEGVSAAAAGKAESQLPSLKHRRSVSNTQTVPLQTRPLSRSPSIASSRPPTAVAQATKKSSLSRVQSTVESNATETKNKDFVSRIVMAGMRLHGLSQSKSRSKHKADSTAPSPAMDASFEELEAERKNDEEFKLIYHQVYKGTCFAFRTSMGAQMLQPFAEQVRETVDKLLAIFCGDPLAGGLQGGVDEVTPGGRKAFGSKAVEEDKRPFSSITGGVVEAGTPITRQGKAKKT